MNDINPHLTGQPLTEAELLSICHAPDHPTRENGLTLRRLRRMEERAGSPSSVTSRNTKRASSISILSGLGVSNPERALEPPSPTSGRLSPSGSKRPSKLRNFFGQRPPSELITTHLTEFFPNAEKKVLGRARNSMMRKRDSVVSFGNGNAFAGGSGQVMPSRFSSSTQGSRSSTSTHPPPVPDKSDHPDGLPRVSLSTEDGRSMDLDLDRSPQLLPPIPFPSQPLSDSMDDIDSGAVPRSQRMSRTASIASKRLSYMTELRSKRDPSDTASLMTVDEITANVESRRESGDDDLDGWTKVDTEIENMVPKAVVDEDDATEVEDEGEVSDSISSDEDEDETLHDEEELSLDVDDDGVIRNIVSARKGKLLCLTSSYYVAD